MAASSRARLLAAAREYVARQEDDPPPGFVGSDRDGAFVYFGPDPVWLPEYEGQEPAVVPAPQNNSAHDPATCATCGTALGTDDLTDDRQTCAGCLRAGNDPRLNAELVHDAHKAADKVRRNARPKQSFAQRRHGSHAEADRP